MNRRFGDHTLTETHRREPSANQEGSWRIIPGILNPHRSEDEQGIPWNAKYRNI